MELDHVHWWSWLLVVSNAWAELAKNYLMC